MKTKSVHLCVAWIAIVCLACASGSAQTIVSGPNLTAPVAPVITINFDPSMEGWNFEGNLLFDPFAGPMLKRFTTPFSTAEIQPGTSFPVWEDFHLDPDSVPISDWHEEIHTAGWEWLIPSVGTPGLITKNGEPWPWNEIPHPGGADPSRLWVEFEPIAAFDPDNPTAEPNVLDIHKRLVWRGPGPWAGNVIEVWENPTPEPGTMVLALMSLAVLATLSRRQNTR